MAKKKSSPSKKKSSKKVEVVEVEQDDAEEIFRSHTRKLGIPEEGLFMDAEDMRATWTGSGTLCSEVLSTIEKKVTANEFSRVEIPEVEGHLEDPVVEALEKLKLKEPRRESIFRKSKDGWSATVMMEHNLGDTSEEDTAAVFFFIEEEEED